ncbi:MAG TPA: hypothetical protein VGF67_12580 [Ktedonobacteraceae bacterium]|jgi:hypothetical protein
MGENAQTTVKVTPAELPAWPPPPRPRPPQGPPDALKWLAIALALLLIIAGLGLAITAATNQYSQALVGQKNSAIQATANSQATVASALSATARPLATTQAQIYASATAQALPTATAAASNEQATATATALSALLTQDTTSTPALDDPLSDNSHNNQWATGYTDNNNTGCNFVNGSYRVQEALQRFIRTCFAATTNFHNFVYQVSLTITSGSAGGLLLRGNGSSGQYYFFWIDTTGNYVFELYNGNTSHTVLASGFSPAILTGPAQSNSLAIIANKGIFSLFVNQTYVAGASDHTLNAGQIGVAAYNFNLPTTVDFSAARVWPLS